MNTYQQEVFSFISSVIGQKNIIPVPVEFIHFTGDANSAMLLTQIFYWSDRTKDPDGWFYKSYEQWFEEIALTKYFARKAITTLKTMEIIETTVKKIHNGDTYLHFRLIKDKFIQLFGDHLQKRKIQNQHNNQKELQILGSSNFEFPEVQTLNFQKPKLCTSFHYTETTTETTATEPPAVVAVKKENPKAEEKDTDSKSKLDLLVKMIPTKHQTPLVIKFIEQKLNDGVDVEELKASILYVKDKAKGNASQFKSYLGKCLDQKWASGLLEEFEAERLRKQEQEAQDAMRAFLEAQERQARQEEEARAKAKDDEIKAILKTIDITDLDNYIESPEIWNTINSFEQKKWKKGERYITRYQKVKNYLKNKLLETV